MLVDEAKTFRELCQENRHFDDAPTAALVRRDEDDACPSESGRALCTSQEEGADDLAGNRLQNIHLFVESGIFREVSMHQWLAAA
jgi:hypothetical protein